MSKFDAYIERVKEQLCCNATDEYKSEYITYNHTNEEVDTHLNYFKQCMQDGYSPYTALLFFHDTLNS